MNSNACYNELKKKRTPNDEMCLETVNCKTDIQRCRL